MARTALFVSNHQALFLFTFFFSDRDIDNFKVESLSRDTQKNRLALSNKNN